jgi:hypothetical protein
MISNALLCPHLRYLPIHGTLPMARLYDEALDILSSG